jgi:membrane protein YqaA with SNARE-associated domain
MIKRLYHWVLHWAHTPYGAPALFLLAFAESSFFPIPPDVLLIALAVSRPTKAFRFALICTVGSVLGGALGYGLGLFFMESIGQRIVEFYGAQGIYEKLAEQFQAFNFWAVFIAAVTPIPYKIFTLAAGACKVNFGVFLAASVLGRSARFLLVAALLWWKGETIKGWLDRYFNWAVTAFTVLLIGGFVVIKWLLK